MRRPLALAFAVWLGAAAAAIAVPGTRFVQTTGDEPHYLVTALSIAEDRSLDVRDEYRDRRYRPFHDAGLVPQASEDVEPHDPLLPALLAAPLAVGGWVAAKLALALCAGALGAALLWTAVRRLGVPQRAALPVVALFGASAPLAVYGAQVYPELPAGLLVVAGLAFPLPAAVLLPWLSVKYAAVAAVLAAFALARSRRRALASGVLVAAAAAYVVLHLRWYGGFTPYAAGSHFTGGELTAAGSDPDYLGRSRRLVGLLADRAFGIGAWQPGWLLAVPAVAALVARRPRGWASITLPLAAGWAVATWIAATMHGWWFPGRHVVAVLPLAVLAVAWWAGRSPAALRLAVGLGALGVAAYASFLVQAYARPLNVVVDFAEALPPWRSLFPSHQDPGALDWALTAAWAGLLAYAAKIATLREWGRTETRAPSGTSSVDGRCETSTLPSSSTR